MSILGDWVMHRVIVQSGSGKWWMGELIDFEKDTFRLGGARRILDWEGEKAAGDAFAGAESQAHDGVKKAAAPADVVVLGVSEVLLADRLGTFNGRLSARRDSC